MLVIELRVVLKLWTLSPISSKHMSCRCPFLELHQTTYDSNIGIKPRGVSGLATSILVQDDEEVQIVHGTILSWILQLARISYKFPQSEIFSLSLNSRLKSPPNPPILLMFEPRMVNKVWAHSPISFRHKTSAILSYIHTKLHITII